MTAEANGPDGRFTALVLAADRGPDDPVSRAAGVDHKCLAPVAGKPMLERVIETLAASPWIGSIAVSLRDPALITQLEGLVRLCDSGRVVPLQAEDTPSQSVLQAVAELNHPLPLLITTADHALLTTEMIDHFCTESLRCDADLTAGVTAAEVILARYPHTKRTYLAFRNERYSGSNIFALRAEAGVAVIELWRKVEQQRKRPWRIAALFGPALLLSYLLRRFSLDTVMARVSERLGVSVAAIKMPFAEAAIDVDKPEDLELVEKALRGHD
ncbi:NTP transferase domain-containing protein [Pelagibius litoralis]|uniref:NTP transferase domain-containing protein n=1 Tax=Pelagibius litoralis TaxID=374515 RepID=A0A967F229_9PROT|nr:nucleotidyltransferase family protein [Pelagibius litoralis]NIA71500.1 NTP transferase domain-containing protein [Pelagibius litoralis]